MVTWHIGAAPPRRAAAPHHRAVRIVSGPAIRDGRQ